MTSRILLSFLFLVLTIFPSSTSSIGAAPNDPGPSPSLASRAPDQSQVERGRYLVEEVAKCGECHSPRNANGELDHSRWMQGAPTWIMPVHHDAYWAERAPALAGFPSFTEEQGEKILEQGVDPEGLALRRPMHTYHLKHEDAVAIIAYLKTLRPAVSPQ